MAEIRLTGVDKVYPGGTHAVHSVDLAIAPGEFMIMVGPSGCAKSTILRMIAGLEVPTGGTIEIDGRVVNDVPPRDRDIAMVFQSYALYPHMTVRANMEFGLKLRKTSQAEIDRRVADAARVLGLEQLLDRLPKAMSGGQRQRVAMGRAIVREPRAFLMDEPLSNLDAQLRVQMRSEIAKLHRRLGTTTVYVTHDQTEAMTLGQRIGVLRGGVVQQVDPPASVYANPANVFVAGFIGSPSMNFLDATLVPRGHGVHLRIGDHELVLPTSVTSRLTAPIADGRPVIAGIRPEHVAIVAPSTRGALPGVVELVESLGSDVFVSCSTDPPAVRPAAGPDEVASGPMIVRPRGAATPAPGEACALAIEPASIHLFDVNTHETLLSPVATTSRSDVRSPSTSMRP